jgi:hypothetical protein
MYYKNPLTYLIALFLLILAFTNYILIQQQQFVLLAKSFLSGSLALTDIGGRVSDTVLIGDKFYWPLGPFPAVLLIPFVYFFDSFKQGYLQFPLNILNFYLVYKIALILKVDRGRSLLLAVFFILGSIYTPVGALPASWYFAQIVSCTLLILSIYEFLTKRRYLLIGIFIAAATATRFTMITASIFFIYYLLKRPFNYSNLLKFLIPLVISINLLGTYNYLRFKNPLESGYKLQLIPDEPKARRDIGLFSIQHIPGNLYYMLFKGPDPVFRDKSHLLKPPFITFDSYGLSIFFLSPILFLIFIADYKQELNKLSLASSLFMLLPIITYYGIGQKQVGYRYALDFLPFLFLITASASKKVNKKILYPVIFFGVFFSIFFTFLYLTGLDG